MPVGQIGLFLRVNRKHSLWSLQQERDRLFRSIAL